MSTSPRRSLGSRLVAIAIGTGVALVLSEAFLRTRGTHFLGAPSEGHGQYVALPGETFGLRPGWTGHSTIEGRRVRIDVNADGRREPELPPRSPGCARVLVLGDSFVFGHGAEYHESIAARLGEHLAGELGRAAVVANAGVPGYGTRDLPLAYERHATFEPDAVIAFVYFGNDFLEDARTSVAVVEGYLVDGPIARVAKESLRFRLTMRFRLLYALELFLRRRWPEASFDLARFAPTAEERAAREHFPPRGQDFAGLFLERATEDELVAKVLERCRRNLTRLRDAVGETPLLLVLLPSWWHVDELAFEEQLGKLGLDPTGHRRGITAERLTRLAEELDLEVLDLTPEFEAAADLPDLWLPVDRHLTPTGYDRVARWLVPFVRERLGASSASEE